MQRVSLIFLKALYNASMTPMLIQAPLAGYSCAPMRKLAQQYGQPDYCCTEMLSAEHLVSGARQKKRYTYKDPQEGKLCVQLAGKHPDTLARACELVQDFGADMIDLNCGCPQPKIRKKGTGSKLLDDPDHLYTLLRAMVLASDVPVTVKIRIDDTKRTRLIADVAERAGVAMLIVHGRRWTERYDVPAQWSLVADLVQRLSIPVIANGDVACTNSAKMILEQTQAAGLMVARASLGQPWLFAEIRAALEGRAFCAPTLSEVGAMLWQHAQELVALESEYPAILQCRKLVKYYARDYIAVPEAAYQMTSLADLHDVIARWAK